MNPTHQDPTRYEDIQTVRAFLMDTGEADRIEAVAAFDRLYPEPVRTPPERTDNLQAQAEQRDRAIRALVADRGMCLEGYRAELALSDKAGTFFVVVDQGVVRVTERLP